MTFLLITDEIPSTNKMGISKTVYNLLENYPASQICLLAGNKETVGVDGQLRGSILREPLTYLKPLANRFGVAGINRSIFRFNYFLRANLPLTKSTKLMGRQSPHFILLATNRYERVIVAKKISSAWKIPVIPYFLDNWTVGQPYKGFHVLIKELLANASGWLMISNALTNQLEKQYQIKAPETFVVHSPAKPVHHGMIDRKQKNEIFTICYAGSLWDMHFDALCLMAEAVKVLQEAGYAITLQVHTPEAQWRHREQVLKPLNVEYRGYLTGQKLTVALLQADLLLVTASFLPAQQHISSTSLQTKVTEYMATGVPVLSVGPDYGECNRFFTDHDCGFVLAQKDVGQARQLLIKILEDKRARERNATKALQLASTKYSQKNIQLALFTFLERIIRKDVK